MLKIFLKIWPIFIPILVYIFWIYIVEDLIIKRLINSQKIIKSKKIFDKNSENNSNNSAEKIIKVEADLPKFSLKNRCFLTVLYMTFALAILSFIALAV